MEKNVDVQKIMEEIKREAQYIEISEDADFQDISIEKECEYVKNINENKKFVFDKFWNELFYANKSCSIDFMIQCPDGNFLATLIRKIMVKLTRFYFKLVVGKQNDYNAYSVRSLNEVAVFIQDTERALNRQNEINTKFYEDIQNYILSLNKDYIKRMEASDRRNRILRSEISDLKRQIDALYEKQELSDKQNEI